MATTAGATLCAPSLSLAAATSATRSFKATRGASSVGAQQITLARSGDVVTIDLKTRLKVKILGITLYRYSLNSREVWEGGQVMRISGKTDDNGKADFVEAERVAGGLNVQGSGYSGIVTGKIATTSFFTTDLIERPVWVSTQNGKPKNVRVAKRGPASLRLPSGDVSCNHYFLGGDLNIPIDAYFDGRGDLVGYMFDAKGERAKIIAQSNSPDLRSIWS